MLRTKIFPFNVLQLHLYIRTNKILEMDEVLEKFETAIITPANDEKQKSNFEDLYKNWGRLGNQEERRKEILEVQKSQRNVKLDKFRGILELVEAVEEDQIFKNNPRSSYKPTIYVAGFSKSSLNYDNVLMLSEWMVEKPNDFTDNWSVVPCPKGVRMLVVANRGKTKFYTKFGTFQYACRTALPGGNPCSAKDLHNCCCVLDCFYQEKNNTAYILDLLVWNNQTMTDGEAEFRNFWLKSQLAEIPELKFINKKNEVIFSLLPMISCSKESFNNFMSTYPPFECNFPKMDGLLFYHNKAHYFSGETPLVGWLFPFMVPEVLGSDVTVHPSYLAEKPAEYTNQAHFIQKFEEKYNKKKRGKNHKCCSSLMDTSGCATESTVDTATDKAQTLENNNDLSVSEATTNDHKCEVKESELMEAEEARSICKMIEKVIED